MGEYQINVVLLKYDCYEFNCIEGMKGNQNSL